MRFKAKLDEQAIGAGKLLRNLTSGCCSLSGQNLCLRCLFLGFSCLGQPILTLFVGLHSLFALLLELRETGAQGIECGSSLAKAAGRMRRFGGLEPIRNFVCGA